MVMAAPPCIALSPVISFISLTFLILEIKTAILIKYLYVLNAHIYIDFEGTARKNPLYALSAAGNSLCSRLFSLQDKGP